MKTILLILLIIIALFLLLSLLFFIAFHKVFKRCKLIKDEQIKDFIKYHHLEPYEQKVRDGINFFKNAKKEEINIKSYDGLNLRGYYIKKEKASNKTIVFCHGYQSAPYFDFCMGVKDYYDEGLNLFFIEERCHEHSEGRYITFGMKERFDILSWATYLNEHHPDQIITLAGVSMGASSILFSLELGLPKNVKSVILDCGFSNAFDEIWWTISKKKNKIAYLLASTINLYMKIFQKVSLKDVNINNYLKNNKIPVFLVHGKSDEMVSLSMAHEIYDNLDCYKLLLLVDNAPHAQSYIYDPLKYKQEVTQFINDTLK